MKLGVIGTSWISGAFVQGAIEAGFEPLVVCSRNEDTGRDFASLYGFPQVVTEVERLAENKEVEVVYIASPNGLHFEQAEICLKHKKHVLVEKPCFAGTDQLEKILALAEENGVYVLETIRCFYNPTLKKLKEALPMVGQIRYAYLQFMKYSTRYDAYLAGQHPAVFESATAGGALGDLGIYNIYLGLYLFGNPKQVLSRATLLESGVDGVSSQILTYDDFLCVISSSKISTSALRSEIQGEKGTLLINDPASISEISFFDGQTERVLIKTGYNDMAVQQNELIRIIKKRDKAAINEAVEFMRATVAFVEKCRNDAGIKYLP